jgi:prepilin-type N-terminal cleavage/methylation domain-containing protein
MIRKIFKRVLARYTTHNQRGFGLVETLAALAILGTSVTAFIAGLSTGTIAVRNQGVTAFTQELAQTQLEYTKSCAYSAAAVTYPLVTAPPGYSITVSVSAVPGTDTNIQKITATVYHGSEATITITGYKVNR